jgi:small-conductance mechanosensitive channel
LPPRANAQVFSSQPYVAAPDPAVEQLRERVEALEADLKTATSKAEALGAALADARRVADEADAGRRRAETGLQQLMDRVEALEDRLTDAAAGGQDANASGAIALTPGGPVAAPRFRRRQPAGRRDRAVRPGQGAADGSGRLSRGPRRLRCLPYEVPQEQERG